VIGGFTINTVFELNKTDDTQCEINVTGQQWWWEFDYPVAADGSICGYMPNNAAAPVVTSGQMVIPTEHQRADPWHEPRRHPLVLGAAPQRQARHGARPCHTWRFQACKPGIYAGQCAEFCGLSHANMRMEIVRLDPPDYQKWLDNQLEPVHPSRGRHARRRGRASVHRQLLTVPSGRRVDQRRRRARGLGTRPVGLCRRAPNLTNLMTRNTFAGASWDLLTEDCRKAVWDASPRISVPPISRE
jgi:cytochrome c oxidase subunit 2